MERSGERVPAGHRAEPERRIGALFLCVYFPDAREAHRRVAGRVPQSVVAGPAFRDRECELWGDAYGGAPVSRGDRADAERAGTRSTARPRPLLFLPNLCLNRTSSACG